MAQFLSIVIAAVVFLFEFALVYGIDIVLDQKSDVDSRWQISPRKSPYISQGSELSGTFSQYLPDDFKLDFFSSIKGIWTVVPNKDVACNLFQIDDDLFKSSENSNENSTDSRDSTTPKPICNVTSSEAFKFTIPKRSISAVSVLYNFGGNATMRLMREDGKVISELTANSKRMNKLKSFDHYIEDAASEVTFTGTVYEKKAYILIDKIIVTVEDSEPTHPPRHSTTSTTPGSSTSSKPTKSPGTTTEPSTNSPNPPTTVDPDSPTTPSPAPASGQEALFPRFANLLMAVFLVAFCVIV